MWRDSSLHIPWTSREVHEKFFVKPLITPHSVEGWVSSHCGACHMSTIVRHLMCSHLIFENTISMKIITNLWDNISNQRFYFLVSTTASLISYHHISTLFRLTHGFTTLFVLLCLHLFLVIELHLCWFEGLTWSPDCKSRSHVSSIFPVIIWALISHIYSIYNETRYYWRTTLWELIFKFYLELSIL